MGRWYHFMYSCVGRLRFLEDVQVAPQNAHWQNISVNEINGSVGTLNRHWSSAPSPWSSDKPFYSPLIPQSLTASLQLSTIIITKSIHSLTQAYTHWNEWIGSNLL